MRLTNSLIIVTVVFEIVRLVSKLHYNRARNFWKVKRHEHRCKKMSFSKMTYFYRCRQEIAKKMYVKSPRAAIRPLLIGFDFFFLTKINKWSTENTQKLSNVLFFNHSDFYFF